MESRHTGFDRQDGKEDKVTYIRLKNAFLRRLIWSIRKVWRINSSILDILIKTNKDRVIKPTYIELFQSELIVFYYFFVLKSADYYIWLYMLALANNLIALRLKSAFLINVS